MDTLFEELDINGNEMGFEVRKHKKTYELDIDPILDIYYLTAYKSFIHNGSLYFKEQTYIIEPDLSKLDAWIQIGLKL